MNDAATDLMSFDFHSGEETTLADNIQKGNKDGQSSSAIMDNRPDVEGEGTGATTRGDDTAKPEQIQQEEGNRGALDGVLDRTDSPPESETRPDNTVIKVNGKEVEVSHDDLVKYAQMGVSANDKFSEASNEKKKLAEFLSAAKSNPEALLKNLGIDSQTFAEQLLTRRIEEQSMTPEQKETRDQKSELENLRKEKEQYARQQQKNKAMQFKNQQAAQLESVVMDAMSDIGLDSTNNEERVHIMSEAMRHVYAWKTKQLKAGNDATVSKDLITGTMTKIMTNRQNVINNYVKTLDAEKLIDFLGKEGTDKVRQHLLGKVKSAPKTGNTAGTGKSKAANTKKASPKYKSDSDWDAIIRG